MRKATVKRNTKETDVEVAVDLDGTGASSIATGIGFLDHMLDLLARHSRIDITVKAKGDLHIDHHHTTEDVGIALGQAVKQALGDMKGITRYADVHLPMDEALTRVAIDISGPAVPGVQGRVRARQGRHLRHRAGAGVVPGVRDECRRHAARRDALRQQRPSYRRILLQRIWRGRCAPRSRSIRARPARCRRPRARSAGRAFIRGRATNAERRAQVTRRRQHGRLHRARAAAEEERDRARCRSASCSCATASTFWALPARRRCGCCGTGCGWCCSATSLIVSALRRRAACRARFAGGDGGRPALFVAFLVGLEGGTLAALDARRAAASASVGLVVGDDRRMRRAALLR